MARPDDGLEAVDFLISAARSRRLVTLCGAGLSAGAVPTAPEMIKEIQRRFDTPTSPFAELDPWEPGAFATAMSSAFGGADGFRQRRAFIADQVFGVAPTAAHRLLARLCGSGCIPLVLTTNFDSLIEVAASQRAERNVKVHIVPESLPPAGDRSGTVHVVKLHGDPCFGDLGNLVEEMDARTDADMRAGIVPLLLDRVLLVVGYGYGDANVMQLLMEAVRAGGLAGLVCAGFTQEDVRPAAGLIDVAREFGTAVAVACPATPNGRLPADELFSKLAEGTNAQSREPPRFGIPSTPVGFAEWLPRFAVAGHHHPPVPGTPTDNRDVAALRAALDRNHVVIYVDADPHRRATTLVAACSGAAPLYMNARLLSFNTSTEIRQLCIEYALARSGAVRRWGEATALLQAMREGGEFIFDGPSPRALLTSYREALESPICAMAMSFGPPVVLGVAGGDVEGLRGFFIDHRCSAVAVVTAQEQHSAREYSHEGDQSGRALVGALTHVRGAYRWPTWERLVGNNRALLVELHSQGLLVRSGCQWYMSGDPLEASDVDRACLGRVADRLVAEARGRSPVAPALVRDAYDTSIRLERWNEAVTMLGMLPTLKHDPRGWFAKALLGWAEEVPNRPRWTRLSDGALRVLLSEMLAQWPDLGEAMLADPRLLERGLEFPHGDLSRYTDEEVSALAHERPNIPAKERYRAEFHELNLQKDRAQDRKMLGAIASRMIEISNELLSASTTEEWAALLRYQCIDNASVLHAVAGDWDLARETHRRAWRAQADLEGTTSSKGIFVGNAFMFEIASDRTDIEWAQTMFTLSCTHFLGAGDTNGIKTNLDLLVRSGLVSEEVRRGEVEYLDASPNLDATGPLRPGWPPFRPGP
jgi:hypothetical protein